MFRGKIFQTFIKLKDQRQAVIDKNNAVLKSQQDEKQAAKDKVLKYNQDLAYSGDAYGLLRMGERYRDGDDVPKDLDKAKEYLSKAVNAGSETASNELLQLNEIPSKNPPRNLIWSVNYMKMQFKIFPETFARLTIRHFRLISLP
jgi:TPR repeat protein